MKKKLTIIVMAILLLSLSIALVACGDFGSGSQSSLTSDNGVAVEGGGFRSGAVLNASQISDEETIDSVKTTITDMVYDKSADIAVYDINVTKGGVALQPSGLAVVTIPLPQSLSSSDLVVFHVKESSVKKLDAAVLNGNVVFETDSFSYFVIAVQKKFNFSASGDGHTKIVQGTAAATASITDTYGDGKKITLTAVADDGYSFVGWYEQDLTVTTHVAFKSTPLSTDATYEFTMPTSNYVVKAVSSEKVTALVLNGASAGFRNTSTEYTIGDTVKPNAQNVEVYSVRGVTYDLLSNTEYTIDLGGLDFNAAGTYTITFTYNADTSIKATYTVVVVEPDGGFRAVVFGNGSISEGSTELPNGYSEDLAEGETVTLTATPDENWMFKGWYEADPTVTDSFAFKQTPVSTDATYEFTAPETAYVVYAVFVQDATALVLNGANAGFSGVSDTTNYKIGISSQPNAEDVLVYAVVGGENVLISDSEYTIDLGGLDLTIVGTYTITFTYKANTAIKSTLTVAVVEPDGRKFFSGLWEAVKGVGDVEVNSQNDFVVNLGYSLELAKFVGAYSKTTTSFTNDYKLDFDFDLVYDQDVAAGATDYSAVRLSIADISIGNLLTVYYALATPDKIYVDFMSTKVQLAVDVDSNEAGDLSANDMLTKVIAKFFNESDFVGFNSPEKALASFTDSFGADFTFNDLAVAFFALFGLDLNELLSNPTVSDILTGFARDFVPPSPDEKVDLLPLILSLSSVLVAEDSLVESGSTYTVKVSSLIRTLIGGFFNGLLDHGQLYLGYSIKSATDKSIDSFFIEGYSNALGSVTDSNYKSGLYFKMVIDELNVRNTTAAANSIGAFDATQYKEMELSAEVVASVPEAFGVLQMNFDTLKFDEYGIDPLTSYDLNGAVKIVFNGGFNFLGEGGNTNAVAKIYYKTNGENEIFSESDLIAEAVYFTVDGRGTLRIDAQKAIETVGVPQNLIKTVLATIANAFKSAADGTPEKDIYTALKSAIENGVGQIEISNIKLPKLLWKVLGWDGLLELAKDYTGVEALPETDSTEPEEIGGETVIDAAFFDGNVGKEFGPYSNKYWKDSNEDGKIVYSELWNLATVEYGTPEAFSYDVDIKNVIGMILDVLGNADAGNYGVDLSVENTALINLLMNLSGTESVDNNTLFRRGGMLYNNSLPTYLEFIAALYKNDQDVIVKMTDACIITPYEGSVWSKATCVYKTPVTITRADALSMLEAAMDTNGSIYSECIIRQLNARFKGSVFAPVADDNVDIFLTLLNSKISLKMYLTDNGEDGASLTADVSYKLATSTAAAHVSVKFTAKAVTAAYSVTDKDIFDADKAIVKITFDAAGVEVASVATIDPNDVG